MPALSKSKRLSDFARHVNNTVRHSSLSRNVGWGFRSSREAALEYSPRRKPWVSPTPGFRKPRRGGRQASFRASVAGQRTRVEESLLPPPASAGTTAVRNRRGRAALQPCPERSRRGRAQRPKQTGLQALWSLPPSDGAAIHPACDACHTGGWRSCSILPVLKWTFPEQACVCLENRSFQDFSWRFIRAPKQKRETPWPQVIPPDQARRAQVRGYALSQFRPPCRKAR